MKMKRFLALLPIIALMTAMLCGSVSAADERIIIDDAADKMTDSEEAEVYSACLTLADLTGWNVAVITVSDAEGKDFGEYATDYYDSHYEYGSDGVLISVDYDNRAFDFSPSGYPESFYHDYRIDLILDEAFVYDIDNQCSQAVVAALNETGFIYSYPSSSEEDYASSNSDSVSINLGGIFSGLIFSVIAFFIAIGTIKKAYKNKATVSAAAYVNRNENGFKLTHSDDVFIREYTTSVKLQSSSSGGRSGGSRHSSGGGRGGGRRF